MANVQLRGLGDDFDVNTMLSEHCGYRVVRVGGDEQNLSATLNVNPTRGGVVSGMCVGMRVDVDAVGMGAYGIDAIAKLHHAPAMSYLRGAAMHENSVAIDGVGHWAIDIAREVGFEDEAFSRLHPRRQYKMGDAYIVHPTPGVSRR
jgi:hypothetical protein